MATARSEGAMWRQLRMRIKSAAEMIGDIAKLTQYCAGVVSNKVVTGVREVVGPQDPNG
jgi:hypothetical protein